MSNFFEKSDLSRSEAENIISDTLQKCDDGELYLENSKSESILGQSELIYNKEKTIVNAKQKMASHNWTPLYSNYE